MCRRSAVLCGVLCLSLLVVPRSFAQPAESSRRLDKIGDAIPAIGDEYGAKVAEFEARASSVLVTSRKNLAAAEAELAKIPSPTSALRNVLPEETQARLGERLSQGMERRAIARERQAAALTRQKDAQARIDALDKKVLPSGHPKVIVIKPSRSDDAEPVTHVHRDYYGGPYEFRMGQVDGGPTLVRTSHPRTGETVSVSVNLPPGFPRVEYTTHAITYVYPDRTVRVQFNHSGVGDVDYCGARRIAVAAHAGADKTKRCLGKIAETTGVGGALSGLAGLGGQASSLVVGPIASTVGRLPVGSSLGADKLSGITERLASVGAGSSDAVAGALTRKGAAKCFGGNAAAPGVLTK